MGQLLGQAENVPFSGFLETKKEQRTEWEVRTLSDMFRYLDEG